MSPRPLCLCEKSIGKGEETKALSQDDVELLAMSKNGAWTSAL